MALIETLTKPLFPYLDSFENSKVARGITTDEESKTAEELLAGYKQLKAETSQTYDQMLAPLNKRRSVIHSWRRNDLEKIDEVERKLTVLLLNYRQRQEAEREVAATEALKLAEAKADADRNVQVNAMRDEVDLIRSEGEAQDAEALEQRAQALATTSPIVEVVPNVIIPPRKSNLATVTRYSAKVSDIFALAQAVVERKVSHQALQPNQTWLNQQARSMKESFPLADYGVELVKTESFKRKGGQL